MSGHARTHALGIIILTLIVATMGLAVVACDPPTIFEPSPTPTPTRDPAPPAPSKLIVLCFDETPSYSVTYFRRATSRTAAWIDELVQPATSGATIYVQYIKDNSYADDATVFTFQVPPIEAAPEPPQPLPTPGTFQANEAKTATAEAAQTQTAYTSETAAFNKTLTQARTGVRRWTNQLRSLPDTSIAPSDIWGCPQRATERFAGVTGARKYLVIASDMEIAGPQEHANIDLRGVHVAVINYACTDVNECDNKTRYWTNAFRQAHALSIQFLDVDETANVHQLFV